MSLRFPRLRTTTMTAALALSLAAVTSAQRIQFNYEPAIDNATYDGRFTFMRLKFDVAPGGYYYRGVPAWAHGHTGTDTGVSAEHQLVRILDAISAVHPRLDRTNVFALDDPKLGQFPVSYMTEAGFWTLSDREAAAFHSYLVKGGFVIFDDFRDPPRGGGGWPKFEANMRRVLPGAIVMDLTPADQIFHSFFDIYSFDAVRQDYDGGRPMFRGIFEDNDRSKRLIAVINFNTDIANYWEYSADGLRPVADSNEAFKLGVNYVIYGLTH